MSDLPTPIPLPDELREMREKATPGVWRAGSNGKPELRNVIHYIDVQDDFGDRLVAYGHLCETDAQFIVALVNWFDTLTATKPSGQVEQLIERRYRFWWDVERDHTSKLYRERAAFEAGYLAALSTQVQTVEGEGLGDATAAKPGLD